MEKKQIHIALAMSGASGAPYFLRLLERLQQRPEVFLHLLISDGGRRVFAEEANLSWPPPHGERCKLYSEKNIGACIASGSYPLHALVVVPCSMNSMGALAAGIGNNLMLRTASVQLKEGRKLILVPRETPLSLIHLRTMVTMKEAGAVMMPAAPSFYQKPETITDLVDTVVDRILDHLNIDDPNIKRWNP